MSQEWIPWRQFFHYTLAKQVYSDFLGAGYKFKRNDEGAVMRFFLHKNAQKVCDKINQESAKEKAK